MTRTTAYPMADRRLQPSGIAGATLGWEESSHWKKQKWNDEASAQFWISAVAERSAMRALDIAATTRTTASLAVNNSLSSAID